MGGQPFNELAHGLQWQQILVRHIGDAFGGHTVATPKIAAIGNREAEVTQPRAGKRAGKLARYHFYMGM
jgi:hypothetical protein